jgi:hypothetical protein
MHICDEEKSVWSQRPLSSIACAGKTQQAMMIRPFAMYRKPVEGN